MKKIVITGGHHSSAVPVISELKRRNPEVTIAWIGHKYTALHDKNTTLEYREITKKGIPFYDLKAGKFYKTYNVFRLIKIPFGFVQSLYLLLKIKPDIIVSFGGYLAVPVVIVGRLLRIPSVTHEQTVVVGYANKLISKFVDKILISWPESRDHFDNKKIIETGLPLRDEIDHVKSSDFLLNSDLPTIYITAGKTGSHKINEIVSECLKDLLNSANVIHQTGDNSVYKDFERLTDIYSKMSNEVLGKYCVRKFIYENNIGEAYNKADLVISRAGAHTCYEILVLAKPSLLIPIPWVSHNEQQLNAENVRNYGLAEILPEKELNKKSFLVIVDHMLKNLKNYNLTKSVKKDNSAAKIVDIIESLIK